jgi:uncharacterized Zn-binding protein involved in type VI secretion
MLPHARVSDKTLCDHGTGDIKLPCCLSVKAAMQSSARFADRAKCPAEPDTIREGASTVLIGGLPASRQSDATYHTGVITTGLTSVKIGGPKITGRQLSNDSGPTNNYVAYDPVAGRLFIVSYLEYHGPDATQAIADRSKEQIERVWSGATTIDGRPVQVTVQVNTSVNPSGTPTPGYDRINIDGTVTRANQTLGGGPGNQTPADVNGTNLVPAHEYGHTLGIEDQYKDTPTGSVPDPTKTSNTQYNLMAQTWNDPDGTPPHPYPEHYETLLGNVGLP